MLIITPTPIGNLKDITLRALEVLQSVDGIICEDTRRTCLLLNHYKIYDRHPAPESVRDPIKIPMIVLNDFNENRMIPEIIQRLNSGQSLALVSDAGTPLISDPGYKLVRECLRQGIAVDSLPGPSSLITALTLSGLPPDKFMFLGYPPEKAGHRYTWLQNLSSIKDITIIIFISPHKLRRTLEDMKEVFGDMEVVLAHELTKIHQSAENRLISGWLKIITNPKGEYILLFKLTIP